MTLATYGILDFVRKENPALWEMAKSLRGKTYKVKLFNFIPVLKICCEADILNCKLFGFCRCFPFG
ncbi:MAG: hypothetical protein SO314_00960 [Alphaproteobacteria bacterium]|nr:hypothetical protein [Alphaproteobacteria bacterium]